MVRRGKSAVASALCLAILVTGCSSDGAPDQLSAAAAQAYAEAAAIPAGPYRLGLGDKLRIVVFGEDELSGEFQVSGAGAVNIGAD